MACPFVIKLPYLEIGKLVLHEALSLSYGRVAPVYAVLYIVHSVMVGLTALGTAQVHLSLSIENGKNVH